MKYKIGSSEIQLLQLYNVGSGHSSTTSRVPDTQTCCPICLSNPISVGYLPCRHVCVCEECARL